MCCYFSDFEHIFLGWKKFIDHATCSWSLLFFNEYYFKLYTNVNKIIADCVFLYPQFEIGMLWYKFFKYPKIFNFTDPKLFELVEFFQIFWARSAHCKQTII